MNLPKDESHRTQFRRKGMFIRYAMGKWHEKKIARAAAHRKAGSRPTPFCVDCYRVQAPTGGRDLVRALRAVGVGGAGGRAGAAIEHYFLFSFL